MQRPVSNPAIRTGLAGLPSHSKTHASANGARSPARLGSEDLRSRKSRLRHTPLPHPYCNPATPGVRENSSEEGTVETLSGEARTEASKTFLKMSALLLVSERN